MLNVGIVGCGDIFPHHRRGWSAIPDARLVGFYDIDPAVARQRLDEGGGGRLFQGIDELIAASDVVDICTPPSSHFDIATVALKGGCHLLIEKPVVLRHSEWRNLLSLADERQLKISALHNQKYFSHNERAKKWLAEGRIGTMLRITDEYMVTPENEWMLGASEHWSHRLPGGRWLETLPHNLYLLHYLAGPLELHQVIARGRVGVDIMTPTELVVVLGDDTRIATIHFSSGCKLDRRHMTIIGSDGIIEAVPPGRVATCSRIRSTTFKKAVGLTFLDSLSKLKQMIPDRVSFVKSRLRPDAHARNIRRFVEHVMGRGPNPTPREEISYTVRLSEAISTRIVDQLRQDPRALRA